MDRVKAETPTGFLLQRGATLVEATLVLPLFLLMVFFFFRLWMHEKDQTELLQIMNDSLRQSVRESLSSSLDLSQILVNKITLLSSGKVPAANIKICPTSDLVCSTNATGGRSSFFYVEAHYTNIFGQTIRGEIFGVHI